MHKSMLSLIFAMGCCTLFIESADALPPNDVSQVQRYAQGAVDRSSGWQEEITNVAENLWSSANVPPELTTEIKNQIRYVKVVHCDETDTTENACLRIGPATNVPALTCAAANTNGEKLLDQRDGIQPQVNPPTDGTPTALWAMTENAVNVWMCVTVYW
jgi:hypothetical protein